MNYFSNKKFWTFVIILLLVINITAMVTIWLQRHRPGRRGAPPQSQRPAEATALFLKTELGFSEEQVGKFLRMQDDFLEQNGKRRRSIGNLKREIYGSLIDSSADSSINDERIARIGREYAEIEKFAFQYFQKLKNLCTPEQREKFDLLLGQILMKIDPMHQPPHKREIPSHLRKRGEKSPHRKGHPPPPGGPPPM